MAGEEDMDRRRVAEAVDRRRRIVDLAVAEHVYKAALSAGLGRSLDMPAK